MDEDEILKSLTKNKDGYLKSLDDLSMIGKKILYCCVHMLMRPNNTTLKLDQRTLLTIEYLSENKNIQINTYQVSNILTNFVNNNGCLIVKEKNEENKTPSKKTEDLKNCVSYYENQCGEHKPKDMYEMLNMHRATFFRKIQGLPKINKVDPEKKVNVNSV